MRKQAHDAINKVNSTEATAQMHQELDRLGGKTHLIRPYPEPPHLCNARRSNRSPITHFHGAGGSGVAFEPPVQPDLIHPTIVQDMRAFDGDAEGGAPPLGQVQVAMDFPSDAFDPHLDFALFPDFDFGVGQPRLAQTPGVASAAGSTPGAGPGVGAGQTDVWMNGQGPPPPIPTGFELNGNGPPVLDATWQAFVEQLGF